MKILALDIATKTGFAILESDTIGAISLEGYGLWEWSDFTINWQQFGQASIDTAMKMCLNAANDVGEKIERLNPDFVVIEQTNQFSASRYTQKILEWLHYAILREIKACGLNWPYYISTSEWRSICGLKMTKEQRKHNKEVKAKIARGKITPKHLAVQMVNELFLKDFIQKDNDICDAILIGYAFLKRHNSKAE